MKAVLQYRATPGFRASISAIENEWLRIVVVDETDKDGFAREIQDADVLLHVLERVTASSIERAPHLHGSGETGQAGATLVLHCREDLAQRGRRRARDLTHV
mgnify:CR=1 FL=1